MSTILDLHYSERLLLRQALDSRLQELLARRCESDEVQEQIKIATELQQAIKDAIEIRLIFDD